MNSFDKEVKERIEANGKNERLIISAFEFMKASTEPKYSYNFKWLGRPIIQYPQDIIALQEIIFETKPDLIIETGIAHGGSIIFSASMLELNALCGGPQDAEVIGIDIEIRQHNRETIENHPMFNRITMLEGSSTAPEIVRQVKAKVLNKKSAMVILDSLHTHEHVLEELNVYAPLVTVGNYCVVFDTIIEDLPDDMFSDRPWDSANNPQTAVNEFLKKNNYFEIDHNIYSKLLITVAPKGYLRRLRG
jgi:cephalosporin hydroxylase